MEPRATKRYKREDEGILAALRDKFGQGDTDKITRFAFPEDGWGWIGRCKIVCRVINPRGKANKGMSEEERDDRACLCPKVWQFGKMEHEVVVHCFGH
jgi:hypothetical protein